MAKKSILERERKREKLVQRYAKKRTELRKRSSDINLPYEERMQASLQLQKMPRNSSPVRLRARCHETGRPRGVYRRFGLAKSSLRLHAMRGDIPGLVKSSW